MSYVPRKLCPTFGVHIKKGAMTDSRDGKKYKTVAIGKQIWMAENLNYKTAYSYCYEDKASNCAKYGRLYIWEAALKACPSGWHLPTKEEFETLISNVGGDEVAGKMLKSTIGWKENKGKSGNGRDKYGFNAIPVGVRYYDGDFSGAGKREIFWSATEGGEYYGAYFLGLHSIYEDASLSTDGTDYAYSVRCLKN